MPRYYVSAHRPVDGLIRKRIIEHSNINYFEKALKKSGFNVRCIHEVGPDVNLEDVQYIDVSVVDGAPVNAIESALAHLG